MGEVLASGFRALNANPRCSEADLRATDGGHGPGRGAPAGALPERAGHHCLGRAVAGPARHRDRHDRDLWLQSPTGGATGGNPAQLAHGISVALYNTAFGLIVAIPALIFWRYFRARVDGYLLTLELASESFVRHLNTLRKHAEAP
jgi:biopolymer transport protein ExbB